MKSSAPGPPRLAVWLLETLLPAESRDVVVGDLVEAHEQRASQPRLVRWLRFWRETLGALAQLQHVPELASAFTPYSQESPMQAFLSDVRRAARTLARARGFTMLCVGSLAIAIGASTAIYSIVNPVVLRSLPYPDADALLTIYEREQDGAPSFTGYSTYEDLRRGTKSLAHAAALGYWQPTLFGEHDAERVTGQVVSWEFFRTIGVRPALGRDFLETEDTPDTRNVVILGHGLWSRRFGSDSSIIGTPIETDGGTRLVVGVMPASFESVLLPEAEIWRPLGYIATQPWACRTCRHLQFVARVRDGVTREQVDRELAAVMPRIVAEHPGDYPSDGVLTFGLQERVTEEARPILLTLFGAALLVLGIAAANVINLQLARAERRREEFAVRAALGGGRRVIGRQLLAEGLVLAVLGGVAGAILALLFLPGLVARMPADLPRLAAIRLDWQALAFTAAVALVIGIAVGLAPALGAGRARVFDGLRGGARALGGGRHRLRGALVVAEVALALMLVVGAALLGRSLIGLLDVDPGFDARNLVTMEVQASGPAYETGEAVLANHDRIREAVRSLPGVADAALASQLPLGGNMDTYGIMARDKPLENPALAPSADRYTVSAEFLRAMRIPIVRGRGFTAAEAADSNVHVAIVSSSLARRIWPGENAVGKYIRLGDPDGPWREVIGIAGDIRHTGLDATQTMQVYIPERQWYWAQDVMVLVARTGGDPAAMVSAIREAVRNVDPLQPIAKIATMDQVIARSTAQRRLGLLLFAAFSAIALLLAFAGIYGVLAGSVAERTPEFGLRSAMGATPGAIVRLVLGQAGRLAAIGILLGTAGAFWLSRFVRALLFGIEPTDPVTGAVAIGAIAAISLAACLIPVRRAVRVDPMLALRSE
jgi:putative ABC transport system permease protein